MLTMNKRIAARIISFTAALVVVLGVITGIPIRVCSLLICIKLALTASYALGTHLVLGSDLAPPIS